MNWEYTSDGLRLRMTIHNITITEDSDEMFILKNGNEVLGKYRTLDAAKLDGDAFAEDLGTPAEIARQFAKTKWLTNAPKIRAELVYFSLLREMPGLKIVKGPPAATDYYTVAELKEMGEVGFYAV